QGAGEALWVVLPVFGALAIAAVLGSVALGGLVFSAKPMAFKLSKLNPLSGLKRIFSAQTLVELVKAMLKAFLVGGVAASAIWYFHDDMLGLMHAAPAAALPRALHLVALCCALIVAALLLV